MRLSPYVTTRGSNEHPTDVDIFQHNLPLASRSRTVETYRILKERLETCEKHIEENENQLALLDVLATLNLLRELLGND